MTAKICIVIKSFENQRSGLLLNTRKIGLPKKQTLYTVLRSPHIDKKSREQFEMRIHKQLLVIETETHKLREKLNWLKLHDLLGVQVKILFIIKPVWIKFANPSQIAFKSGKSLFLKNTK